MDVTHSQENQSLMRSETLAVLRPDIAKEWHPTRNSPDSPQTVSGKSKHTFWWLGKDCGHEWDMTVFNRARAQNPRCPYCAGKRVLVGFNDLKTLYPDIAAQWHSDPEGNHTPESVTQGSGKKIQWECAEGHQWIASVKDRVNQGHGCPYCAGKLPIRGVTDFGTLFPELAAQWHPELNCDKQPHHYLPHSDKDLIHWLHPECGHTWETTIKNRTRHGALDCRVCKKNTLEAGINDLQTLYPNIAAQWHPTKNGGLTAEQVTESTQGNYMWKCDQGHEWDSPISRRTRLKTGCPVCTGRRVISGYNDMVTLNPVFLQMWDTEQNGDIQPDSIGVHSKQNYHWMGQTCEHKWVEPPTRLYARDFKCPYCSGRKLLTGFNDLATLNPSLSEQWHDTLNHPLTPSQVTPGADIKVWWTCEVGHDWEAVIYSRHDPKVGCSRCAYALGTSKGEREVLSIVGALTSGATEIKTSVRNVIPGELDIYLPDLKLAIEYNGLHWHSDTRNPDIAVTRHADKTRVAIEQGIQLIHVWEDDWRERRDIVIRALAHRLGATERLNESGVLLAPDESLTRRYGARTLAIEVLKPSESAAFLETNHIQGSSRGTLHTGLRDKNGTLRAVFVAKRVGNTGHEGSWRIERYATRGIVAGGFTRLMKFTETLAEGITQWVTFSDSALSDGALYKNHGFTQDRLIPADYQYVVAGERVHKFNYRLKRFRDDPNLVYQEGLSERELALMNGIPRIWDSGKIRWVKVIA